MEIKTSKVYVPVKNEDTNFCLSIWNTQDWTQHETLKEETTKYLLSKEELVDLMEKACLYYLKNDQTNITKYLELLLK